MIITRAPFRVSFCGGGSDIPVFYREYGGCVLNCAIQQYIYLTMHDCLEGDQIILKYSKTEIVDRISDIEHRIFRTCLADYDLRSVEITSIADIPAGTGLGSSSSFTVALILLLNTYLGNKISVNDLAEYACELEIDKLSQPIGKQDQYAAAFGGLNYYEFMQNGDVRVEPIIMTPSNYTNLENNLLLFYIGGTHDASIILTEQINNYRKQSTISAQKKMCEITKSLRAELNNNNIDAIGEMMHENWLLKRALAKSISNPRIDEIYDAAIKKGASGGKLLGAGGCGFMLFYVKPEKQASVREILKSLKEVKFKIDYSGATIITQDSLN